MYKYRFHFCCISLFLLQFQFADYCHANDYEINPPPTYQATHQVDTSNEDNHYRLEHSSRTDRTMIVEIDNSNASSNTIWVEILAPDGDKRDTKTFSKGDSGSLDELTLNMAGSWMIKVAYLIGNDNGSYGIDVNVYVPEETVSTPTSISGPSTVVENESRDFTASGASSSFGHSLEYRFRWGDGTNDSDWGSATQSHSFTNSGDYSIKAQARCSTDTDKESPWSDNLHTVNVNKLPLQLVYAECSVSPSTAKSGDRLTVTYRVYNPNSSSVMAGFGCSIAPTGTESWQDDNDDVVVESVPSGNSTHTRYFDIDSGAGSGIYTVWYTIKEENMTGENFDELKRDDLTLSQSLQLVYAECSVSPSTEKPGDRLTVTYRVFNPNSSPVTVGFGCSIAPTGTESWQNDNDDDVVESVSSGNSTHTRYFDIDSGASSGIYTVWYTIKEESMSGADFDELKRDDLTVLQPLQLVDAECSVSPSAAKSGYRLTVTYRVNNPNSSSVTVGFGCSIAPTGTESWQDDNNDDVVKSVSSGYSTHTRYFDISSDASSGIYTVWYAIKEGSMTGANFDELKRDDLTVTQSLQLVDAECSVSPSAAKPGERLTVTYRVYNSNSSSVTVGFGCSISHFQDSWQDDNDDDVVKSVPSGYSTHTRYFDISSDASSGIHTVWYAIKEGSMTGDNFDELKRNDLTVTKPLQLVDAECSVSPSTAKPGERLTVIYRVYNPNSSSVTAGFGCSIAPTGTESWQDDNDDDVVKSVSSGYSTHARYFNISSSASYGIYTVWYAIKEGNMSGANFDELKRDDLTVKQLLQLVDLECSVSPSAAKPGERLTVTYRVYNPNSSSVTVGFDFSIAHGAESWQVDDNDDVVKSVSIGYSTHTRYFDISSSASYGIYTVWYAIKEGSMTGENFDELKRDDLTLLLPLQLVDSECSVSPSTAKPGERLTVTYRVYNPNSLPGTVGFACSIAPTGTESWQDDNNDDNDVVKSVPSGYSTHTRYFDIGPDASYGIYTVWYEIKKGSMTGENFDELKHDDLTVYNSENIAIEGTIYKIDNNVTRKILTGSVKIFDDENSGVRVASQATELVKGNYFFDRYKLLGQYIDDVYQYRPGYIEFQDNGITIQWTAYYSIKDAENEKIIHQELYYYDEERTDNSGLLQFFVIERPDSIHPERTPLVLLHGVEGNAGYWGNIPKSLTAEGFDVWSVYYPNVQGILSSARLLKDALNKITDEYNEGLVDIVAHSMGGLVARAYIMWDDDGDGNTDFYDNNISHLMMIGTPNHGSEIAHKVHTNPLEFVGATIIGKHPSGDAYRDLSPGSSFLWNINKYTNVRHTDPVQQIVIAGTKNLIIPHTEAIEHHTDGVVSVSSASLLDLGIPLATVGYNHYEESGVVDPPNVFFEEGSWGLKNIVGIINKFVKDEDISGYVDYYFDTQTANTDSIHDKLNFGNFQVIFEDITGINIMDALYILPDDPMKSYIQLQNNPESGVYYYYDNENGLIIRPGLHDIIKVTNESYEAFARIEVLPLQTFVGKQQQIKPEDPIIITDETKNLTLNIPANSLKKETFLSIKKIDNQDISEGMEFLPIIYDINGSGDVVFEEDNLPDITFKYEDSDLNGMNENSLLIFTYLNENNTWLPLPEPYSRDTEANTISTSIRHLSLYSVGEKTEDLNEPIASLIIYNNNPCIGDIVTFSAKESYSANEYRMDYEGDGTFDTSWEKEMSFSCSYYENGIYHPTLEVKNLGYTDSISKQLVVEDAVLVENHQLPTEYSLLQNYPNPFNPKTTIIYKVPIPGIVTFNVYSFLGQKVAILVDEFKKPGVYSVIWDAQEFPTGIYFYEIRTGEFYKTKKMILIK
ncbi:T9SS type A sorting domain-containing protein [Candidatus Latescibacterota bacterium]